MSIIHIAFYPSDWLAGTRGLSDAETGIYITLIARMYEMAGPIERDDARLARLCGCKSRATFVKALDYLIFEGKITEVDGGLFNERVEKEIENTTQRSSKAKAAAQSRWARKSNKNNEGSDAGASVEHMPQPCQSESEPDISKDTNVSLCNSKPTPANDVAKAVTIFNDTASATGWPKVQKVTPTRSKQIRARLADCGGVDGWRVAVEKAQSSDFLCGRTAKPWSGFGLDWLIKSQNFTKLMEGNYDNRAATNAPASSSPHSGSGGVGSGTVDAFAAVAARLSAGTGGG